MIAKSEFYRFFKEIPKAEIHVHFEAIIRRDSIKKLYQKKFGHEMSDEEITELFSYNDLNGFIQAYLKVQDLYTEVSDFDLVFKDFRNYLIENGISYCEVFASPSAFLKKGFDFAEMMQNYKRNIEKIEKETGIIIRMLIDVSRTFGPENAEHNLTLLLENKIPQVIGIGLGGSESKGPAKDFGAVFERARKNGLHVVAHAGEDMDAFSIWDSLRILHAQRIGHGLTTYQDEELIRYMEKEQIPLEVCPTSNVFTKKYVSKFSEHPVRGYFDRNLLVTINTDDPLFFEVSLIDEYWNIHSKLNFTKPQLKQIIINSFKASFLEEEKKAYFINLVEEAWSK